MNIAFTQDELNFLYYAVFCLNAERNNEYDCDETNMMVKNLTNKLDKLSPPHPELGREIY